MLTVPRQDLIASAAVTADRPTSYPARPPSYDKKVGLVLQGGAALGSYQAGVYEALASFEYLPDWVAGISIGAINAAIIAGNTPEKRLKRLRAKRTIAPGFQAQGAGKGVPDDRARRACLGLHGFARRTAAADA
jgi:predicted acylesterase/phospholipase RssA